MTWHFSQVLAAAYSQATCSDGELCAPSKSTPMHEMCCSQDRTTEPSNLSPCGMTFELSTDDLGAKLLTWYRAGFHAKTLARPVHAGELTAPTAVCGSTWRALLARYDRDTCTWKTVQRSLFEESIESPVTWPQWGMTRDGALYPLPTWARRTNANACGLWPTPTVTGNHNRAGISRKAGDGLSTAVKQRTPLWCKHGPLNPAWVEWLMGWPIGWTDCAPLETGRFQEWRRQHGKFSRG